VFLYVWLFALGATVGSFLNVVVYRLPRGKNLAVPGSYCPRCGHPIRLSDNIPILSWLALGGRCRDCRGRISARYFFVELLVATTFLVVLVCEHFLPPGAIGFAARRVLTPYDGPPFWGMYGLHLLLLVTIYAAVLIAGDGYFVPLRLFAPLLIVGLALPLVWPQVRSVPASGTFQMGWQAGLVDGVLGLVAGAAVGIAFDAVAGVHRRKLATGADDTAIWTMAAIGLVVGWQRVLWMGPVTMFLSAWVVGGLRASSRARSKGEHLPPMPTDAPEASATTGLLADQEAISEEVHIVSPPIEPTEPS
jgi:leader peptidase (prepilin peptidase)/N-methyltransferase